MNNVVRFLAVALLTCTVAFAQESGASQPQQTTPEPKKEEKKKKDKKQQDDLDTAVFTDRVASDLLRDIRDGLEGHSQRLLLSAFDGDKMDGFLSFEDQIQTMFDRYDAFRVQIRIAQTTVEGPRGIILVDFSLEEIPAGGGSPVRKREQIRFEVERGRKGWKVVDLRPRGFFS